MDKVIAFALFLMFPIVLVATIMWYKKKENDNLTKVLLSALEKGRDIDSSLFAPKKSKNVNKWTLLMLLISGCGVTIFGIGLFIVSLVRTVHQWNMIYEDELHHISYGNFAGCAFFLAIGIALLIGYVVGKKMLKPDLEQEELLAKK